MKHPYQMAPSKEVGIALWILERFEWTWRRTSFRGLFMRKARTQAKCAAIIVHDRVLNGEVQSRGLPFLYGRID